MSKQKEKIKAAIQWRFDNISHLESLEGIKKKIFTELIIDPDLKCGVAPFSTSSCDPMSPCCLRHDIEYVLKEMGVQEKSRRQVDKEFLACMQIVAGDSKRLRLKARLYYSIVRSTGWVWWYVV